jgi:hypothetical protein
LRCSQPSVVHERSESRVKELKQENINMKKRLEKLEEVFEQQIFVFNK